MELIDRAALAEQHFTADITGEGWIQVIKLDAVFDAPAIDAAPVVRCKNCRHSSRIAQDTTDRMWHCWSGRGRNNGDGFSRVRSDGYCDDGERKEGEHG